MSVFGLGAEVSADELLDLRKKDLGNLLTSYADEADVFAEMIQNAMDSVQTAIAIGRYGAGEKPRIQIFLGRRSGDTHYFAVHDNGLGMEPGVARKFTVPGFSLRKKRGKTVGYKGVGASFFVAASNKFSLSTIGESGAKTDFTIEGAHRWIRNETEPAPKVEEVLLPAAVTSRLTSERGTCVCFYFHTDVRPSSMSHVVTTHNDDPAREIGNWAGYLCAKSALGQIRDISTNGIVVTFHLDFGDSVESQDWRFGEFDRVHHVLGYPYPNRVFSVAKQVTYLDGLSPPKQLQIRHTLQAVTLNWSKEDINSLATPVDFNPEEQKLVDDHLEDVQLFFACSTKIMDTVKERLGARSNQLRFGIRIAVDGVPQGRMMDFVLTSSQGLDRQAHAVIAFKTLELDTGRKIPAEETISEVIRKIGVRLISHIKDYREYLKRKEITPPAANIDAWRTDVMEARRDSIVDHLFKELGVKAPIVVDPRLENDVIALFGGMIASELLKGFKLCALSGMNTYDGLIDIDCDSTEVQDPHDPLSVRAPSGRSGQLRVLEFKHDFGALLVDFDEGKKNPVDIDLLVCWDLVDGLNVRRGSFEYWYEDHADMREMYGVTHLWRDDNNSTDIPVIALKYVVCMLLRKLEARASQPGIGTARLRDLLEQDRVALIG